MSFYRYNLGSWNQGRKTETQRPSHDTGFSVCSISSLEHQHGPENTFIYHLAKIKKFGHTQCQYKCEKAPHASSFGVTDSTFKNTWQDMLQFQRHLPLKLAIPCLGICLRDILSHMCEDAHTGLNIPSYQDLHCRMVYNIKNLEMT